MININKGLYLVALPIGNLGDISARALETLHQVDEIWAEDTRNIRKLLHYFDIDKSPQSLIACHDHNEREMSAKLIEKIDNGMSIAYVSDAGMPVISDPGFRLVRAAQDAGAYVSVVPGASAVVSAIALSGLPSDEFAFLGFIPTKTGKRATFFEKIRKLQMTIVAFESPKRIKSSLQHAQDLLGDDAEIAIVREITKTFEEVIRGKLSQINTDLADRELKGEIVVLFAPIEAAKMDDEFIRAAIREALKSMRMKEAVRMVADHHQVARNRVYDLALEVVKQD